MWFKHLYSLVWQRKSTMSISILEKEYDMQRLIAILNYWIYNTLIVLNEKKSLYAIYNSAFQSTPPPRRI